MAQISINNTKYTINKDIFEKYFILKDVTSERFVGVHDYISEIDGVIANIDVCNLIVAEIQNDFIMTHITEDAHNHTYRCFIKFVDLYLDKDVIIPKLKRIQTFKKLIHLYLHPEYREIILYDVAMYSLVGLGVLRSYNRLFWPHKYNIWKYKQRYNKSRPLNFPQGMFLNIISNDTYELLKKYNTNVFNEILKCHPICREECMLLGIDEEFFRSTLSSRSEASIDFDENTVFDLE